MSAQEISLSPGVQIEQAGDDLMVLVPGRGEALVLTGGAAELVAALDRGEFIDEGSSETVDLLIEHGVVEQVGVSRRGLLRAGAVGLGAGITVLAMPGVAAASSQEGVNTTRFTATGGASVTDTSTNPNRVTFFGVQIFDGGSRVQGGFFTEAYPATVTLQNGTSIDVDWGETSGNHEFEASSQSIDRDQYFDKTHQIAFTLEGVSYQASFTPSSL